MPAKGTPWHPHRGFETVTYMIDGIFRHQDSNGGGGLITDGKVSRTASPPAAATACRSSGPPSGSRTTAPAPTGPAAPAPRTTPGT